MAVVQGMGVCLIPTDGIPCGRQIEEGEPIGTLALPFGGTVVGHKACVDGYTAQKEQEKDDTMVKRVDQAGPGGPVDMTKATDALVGSVPLEQGSSKEDPVKQALRVTQGVADTFVGDQPTPDWGEGVRPVAEVPLGSPPPEAQLPENQPWLLRKFTPTKNDEDEDEEPVNREPWADDLDNRFTYHPPTDEQVVLYEQLRESARYMAHLIVNNCPNSRERSLALTHLDETVMWSNAAIARHS